MVELCVRHLVGDDLTHEQREAIRRVGCRTQAAGLRTMDEPDPAIVIDALRARYPTI